MAKILALFSDLDGMVRALDAMAEKGIAPERLDASSAIPLPRSALGWPELETSFQVRWSVLIGLVGALLGFLLAAGTAWHYPLPTGGKPIVSMPTVGIIMYETTMLAAIWTAFFVALYQFWTRRLPGLPEDMHQETGALGLVLFVADAMEAEVEPILSEATEVRKWA